MRVPARIGVPRESYNRMIADCLNPPPPSERLIALLRKAAESSDRPK